MADTKSTKSGPPAHDWHSFQAPFVELSDEEQEEVNAGEREPELDDRDECETCGEGHKHLMHQVDEAGNPTDEARQAYERGDYDWTPKGS